MESNIEKMELIEMEDYFYAEAYAETGQMQSTKEELFDLIKNFEEKFYELLKKDIRGSLLQFNESEVGWFLDNRWDEYSKKPIPQLFLYIEIMKGND